jgi:hypothetical protein
VKKAEHVRTTINNAKRLKRLRKGIEQAEREGQQGPKKKGAQVCRLLSHYSVQSGQTPYPSPVKSGSMPGIS